MTRLLALAGAIFAAALLWLVEPGPADAALRQRTPTATPTLDLRGQFRVGQVVEWVQGGATPTVGPSTPTPTPRAAIFVFSPALGMGGSTTQTLTVRVSTPVADLTLHRLVRTGQIDVLVPPPAAMAPGQDYAITLRLTRPRDRRPVAGYVQLKSGGRFLAPMLAIRTRNLPGER